jgi:TM2 domain-containing membrane protein YozV
MRTKRKLPAFLLCFFLGCFGAHRFYVGKIGTGILQLLTLGGLSFWAFIDLLMIIDDDFTVKWQGKITQWI